MSLKSISHFNPLRRIKGGGCRGFPTRPPSPHGRGLPYRPHPRQSQTSVRTDEAALRRRRHPHSTADPGLPPGILWVRTSVRRCVSIVTVSDGVVSLRKNLCRGLNFRASFKRSLKPSCVRHFKDGVWRFFAAERREVQGPAAGRQDPRPPPRGRALPRLCAWVPRSSPGVADPGAHGAWVLSHSR